MTRRTAPLVSLVSLAIGVGSLVLGVSTLAASGDGGLAPAGAAVQVVTSAKTTTSPPMTLALTIVTGDLAYFAGQYVRIPTARVHEVLSPRMFTVEPSAVPSSGMRRLDGRALVVMDGPASGIEKGMVVEIVGRPWTFAGAQSQLGAGWVDELEDDADDYEFKPIIGADIVRTPGGVELSGGASRTK